MKAAEHRLLVVGGGLLVMLAVATAGYRHLEGWSWLQSAFFAVTTVTTIGYGDYGMAESSKVFTIGLIAVGVLFWLSLVNAFVEYAASHWAERARGRQERELARMRDHFIVVGYGAVGQQVVAWLRRAGRAVLIVDSDETLAHQLADEGLPCLVGDATDEATLRRAGLERAAGLLAVTRADPVNVFVTLTARAMRPDVYIAANASTPGVADKLLRAGATTAISPYALGAQRLAQAALSPHVAELLAASFTDGSGLMLREAELEAASSVCGKTLRDSGLRQQTGCMVVAHKPAGGAMTANPSPDVVLGAGDILIAFGQLDYLTRFVALVSPATAAELSVFGSDLAISDPAPQTATGGE